LKVAKVEEFDGEEFAVCVGGCMSFWRIGWGAYGYMLILGMTCCSWQLKVL
jgi:hypothetical protein